MSWDARFPRFKNRGNSEPSLRKCRQRMNSHEIHLVVWIKRKRIFLGVLTPSEIMPDLLEIWEQESLDNSFKK